MDPRSNQHQLNFLPEKKVSKENTSLFSPYRLSNSKYYIRFCSIVKNHFTNGDPCGNRTHVCGVRGRRLSRLTNGPHMRVAYLPTPSKPNNERAEQAKPCINMLRSSPRRISTGQLHTLPCFHLRPINDVVHIVPYLIKSERSNLRGSFTLRCLQRLSRPDVATQLCPWQDNWCTRGLSIPVLSY